MYPDSTPPVPPALRDGASLPLDSAVPLFFCCRTVYLYSMTFRCPLCRSTAHEPVTVRRRDGSIYVSSLQKCAGCSVVFADAERFSRPAAPSRSATPSAPDFRVLWGGRKPP
jgi:hypothetical protein